MAEDGVISVGSYEENHEHHGDEEAHEDDVHNESKASSRAATHIADDQPSDTGWTCHDTESPNVAQKTNRARGNAGSPRRLNRAGGEYEEMEGAEDITYNSEESSREPLKHYISKQSRSRRRASATPSPLPHHIDRPLFADSDSYSQSEEGFDCLSPLPMQMGNSEDGSEISDSLDIATTFSCGLGS